MEWSIERSETIAMTKKKMTVGYCRMCMQNVEHTRVFSSSLFNLLDLLSLRLLQHLRIGPWYCFQCEQRTSYLAPKNLQLPTFDTENLTSRFEAESPRELVNDQSEDGVSVGNYLKTEHSLVMRDKRSRKYSQKFRDATVLRILSGGTSLSQARHELDVKENDIVDWIASLFNRKLERINELTIAVQAVRAKLPERLQYVLDNSQSGDSESGATVVEGRTVPK